MRADLLLQICHTAGVDEQTCLYSVIGGGPNAAVGRAECDPAARVRHHVPLVVDAQADSNSAPSMVVSAPTTSTRMDSDMRTVFEMYLCSAYEVQRLPEQLRPFMKCPDQVCR